MVSLFGPIKRQDCRRFDTTQEMSQHIVEQINKYVGQDDILIHLGDWSFGGIENIWNFRKQLNVKTIYLCAGNHDNSIKKNYTAYQCVDENIKYVSAQSLFEVVDDYLEIMIEKNLFCCMHFPIEEWNDGIINLICYMDILMEILQLKKIDWMQEWIIFIKYLVNINQLIIKN